MERACCPNCGEELVRFRTDRQMSGTQEVEMEWAICEGCRHVALSNWQFHRGPIPAHQVPTRIYHARPGRRGG